MPHLDEGTLHAWLDGPRSGLIATELDEIGRHLSDCAACSGRLEALESISRRAQALLSAPEPESEPVPPFGEVRARAHRNHASGRRRSAWTAAAWAASVVAAVGAGWMANDLNRGAEVTRSAAESPSVELPAPPAVVVADAAPPRDAAAPVVADTATTVVANAAPPPAVAAPVVRNVAVADVAVAPAATVRGRVTDESGTPLGSVQVFVEGTRVGTLSRQDGTFALSLDPLGADSAAREVTLMAEMIGYQGESRALTLGSGDSVSTDFRLAQQAIALDALVVTATSEPAQRRVLGSSVESVEPIEGVAPESWRTVSRAEAEAEAGFQLLSVPDLRVVRLEVGFAGGSTLVRVVQELDGGGMLELVEGRGTERVDAAGAPEGRARVSVRRGDVWVTATAPLATDVLEALLERLR